MKSYYAHLRGHYAMSRVGSIIEIVKSWFLGDIENRNG